MINAREFLLRSECENIIRQVRSDREWAFRLVRPFALMCLGMPLLYMSWALYIGHSFPWTIEHSYLFISNHVNLAAGIVAIPCAMAAYACFRNIGKGLVRSWKNP